MLFAPGEHDSVVNVVRTGEIVVVVSVKVVSVLLLAIEVYWVNVGVGVHAILSAGTQPGPLASPRPTAMKQMKESWELSWLTATESVSTFSASWPRN